VRDQKNPITAIAVIGFFGGISDDAFFTFSLGFGGKTVRGPGDKSRPPGGRPGNGPPQQLDLGSGQPFSGGADLSGHIG